MFRLGWPYKLYHTNCSVLDHLKKRCGILSKLTMKTPEKRQCFLTPLCQQGLSGGYSCAWICFNIYLSIMYFMWWMLRNMRWKCVPPNVTRSIKLWGAQCSPELAFRSMNFCLWENLIFPVLKLQKT